jgi:hypothetical protein
MARMKIKPREIQHIMDLEGLEQPKPARGHQQKTRQQVHKNKRAYNRKKHEPLD